MCAVDSKYYTERFDILFPNAKCELDYQNIYQLSVAVILSAQTSDAQVNKVTPNLFKKYSTVEELSLANPKELMEYIKMLGLAERKSEYLIRFAKAVIEKFNGAIPKTIEELITIPGIGRKTANVIVSEGYHLPGFAVDVHVTRVSKRLGLASESDNPDKIEFKLKEYFPIELWHKLHHQMIFMGRYLCKSQKPECDRCLFRDTCKFYQEK